MKKNIADKWVAALRSGKYTQGKSRLKTDTGFCCLGVLCDIAPMGKWNDSDNHFIEEDSYQNIFLSHTVKDWAGISDVSGYFVTKENKVIHLTNLNDDGTKFNKIADIIEEHYEAI